MQGERLNKITKIILDIMFYSGIIILVTLPFSLKLAGIYYSKSLAEYYWIMLVIFGCSGICGILIVHQLRKMMQTVVKQDCFVNGNVKSLKMMGEISFVIAVLFIIKSFVLPTPATFIIVLTFFIAGLFSLVLACVFSEAVRYKEENDLTI